MHNTSADHALAANTSLRLQLDHAALVSQGAKVNGSNLHIVASRGGVDTALHRVLDPGSAWNRSDTALWFSLDQALAADQRENTVYHLVVHPEQDALLEDPDQVFLLYDNFDAPSLDLSKWVSGGNTLGEGTSSVSLEGGQLTIRATATGAQSRSQWVRTAAQWQLDSIAVDTSLRTSVHTSGQDCTREFFTGFWSPDNSTFIRGVWLQRESGLRFGNHQDTEPFGFVKQRSAGSLESSELAPYSTRWKGQNFELWRNKTLLDTKSATQTAFAQPSHAPTIVGFESVGVGVGGDCTNQESMIAIDWVIVRQAGMSEPTVTLEVTQQTLRDL